MAHWVLQQDLQIQLRLWSWHSRKWVGKDDKVSFMAVMRQTCFFHFLTKAGSFQDSISELRALTATISGAPFKTTYFILLALSHLYKFHSGIWVRQWSRVCHCNVVCVTSVTRFLSKKVANWFRSAAWYSAVRWTYVRKFWEHLGKLASCCRRQSWRFEGRSIMIWWLWYLQKHKIPL